jgi:hypothetical protein
MPQPAQLIPDVTQANRKVAPQIKVNIFSKDVTCNSAYLSGIYVHLLRMLKGQSYSTAEVQTSLYFITFRADDELHKLCTITTCELHCLFSASVSYSFEATTHSYCRARMPLWRPGPISPINSTMACHG